MSCGYQEWQEGIQTFSSYVPGYAQGAYFPGDEPYYKCVKVKDECGDPYGDMPKCCHIQEDTGWLCPACRADGENVPLHRNGRGIVYCEYGHNYGVCQFEPPQMEEELCEA